MKKNIVYKKACLLIMALMMIFSFAASSKIMIANVYAEAERKVPRLVDSADVLTDEEEANLLKKLDEISEKQKFDIVINTIDGENYSSITQYADDYFDNNGFGYGKSGDGAVLVMDYSSRDGYISTKGKAIKVITDEKREEITGKFAPYITNGEAYKGFDTFIDLCNDAINKYNTKKLMISVAGSLIPALLLALIVCSILTSQLKTVKEEHTADNYEIKDSFYLSDMQDFFLYKNVRRTKREKSSSSGGDSKTHTSSSGSTHGGGGFKF